MQSCQNETFMLRLNQTFKSFRLQLQHGLAQAFPGILCWLLSTLCSVYYCFVAAPVSQVGPEGLLGKL